MKTVVKLHSCCVVVYILLQKICNLICLDFILIDRVLYNIWSLEISMIYWAESDASLIAAHFGYNQIVLLKF